MANTDQIIEIPHRAIDLPVHDFQNADWKQSEPVQINRYWSGEKAPAGRHAEARILWSSKALHVRFVCPQTEPLVVTSNPQTSKKTMGLWDRDVCEIFIAPDPAVVERYLEFEAAPNGEWLDIAINWSAGKRESDWKFNSHMTTAAKIEDYRVTLAMRIPWGDCIHQPQRGERWRVNLFRCVGKDPNRGYLSWQPTHTAEPLFHVPQAFGSLVFK